VKMRVRCATSAVVPLKPCSKRCSYVARNRRRYSGQRGEGKEETGLNQIPLGYGKKKTEGRGHAGLPSGWTIQPRKRKGRNGVRKLDQLTEIKTKKDRALVQSVRKGTRRKKK